MSIQFINLLNINFYSKLAELMLPDGAHLREEDWTSFVLNQHIVEDVINIIITNIIFILKSIIKMCVFI